MHADFLTGAQVFRHLNYHARGERGRLGAGAGRGTFDARRGFDDFQIYRLRQFERQQLAVPGQHLHIWHTAFRHKQQLFFNLVFGKGIWRIVFFIHKDVLVAVDIREIDKTTGQRDGVQDIVAFETLFHFLPGADIGKTHFVQRSRAARARRLNIDIFHNQQFAVVIQHHTFFNFIRSWHRRVLLSWNMQNIATSYSRGTRQASGITHIARRTEKVARGVFFAISAVTGEAKRYNARLSCEEPPCRFPSVTSCLKKRLPFIV
ncbi:hypothetical protein BN130_1488 [Cronobacter malonaticus 507]|nr:hypothetical protein BN130_1488 [Cronobacter malonaticus 507]